MFKINGILLMLSGLLHSMLGCVSGWPQLTTIYSTGLWRALTPHSQALCMQSLSCMQINAMWWFIVFGFMLFLIGLGVHWVEWHLQRCFPYVFCCGLFLVSIICGLLMPASGFWFVAIIALNMIICRVRKR